jgi:hypothetical protein
MQLNNSASSSSANKVSLTYYFASIICELWATATLMRCRTKRLDFVTVSALFCCQNSPSLRVRWMIRAAKMLATMSAKNHALDSRFENTATKFATTSATNAMQALLT